MSYAELSHPDLVQACLAKDEDAWKEFTVRYKKVISLAVLRTARRWGNTSTGVLEDLIGDTYLKLCAKDFKLLRYFEFRTEAALYGYLKVVATNVVHDHFRHVGVEPEVDIEELYETAGPPERDVAREIERNVLIKEVKEALDEVTGLEGERDRKIFWLYYRQGFTAEEIAGLVDGLGTKGVESAIHRLSKAVSRSLTDKDSGSSPPDKKGNSQGSPF